MFKDIVALTEFYTVAIRTEYFGLGFSKVDGVLKPIAIDAEAVVLISEIHIRSVICAGGVRLICCGAGALTRKGGSRSNPPFEQTTAQH